MSNERICEEIGAVRKKESQRIWQFLLGMAALTFLALILFMGFFRDDRAWIAYSLAAFALAGWLAFHLLNLESRKQELEEKNRGKKRYLKKERIIILWFS